MTEPASPALRLRWLPGRYGVYRLPADAPVPEWANQGEFNTVSRSGDELSVLAAWRGDDGTPFIGPLNCCALEGPLDFVLTGILARITAPLADGGISVFSVATYDTDYVLVGEADSLRAQSLLEAAGMLFVNGIPS